MEKSETLKPYLAMSKQERADYKAGNRAAFGCYETIKRKGPYFEAGYAEGQKVKKAMEEFRSQQPENRKEYESCVKQLERKLFSRH